MGSEYDYVIVGGGLQGALIVLALQANQRGTTMALVDRGARLGGNHTWCFHAGDLGPRAAAWVEPLVVYRWPGYRVRFPGLERELERPYAAITSERLHEVLEGRFTASPGSRLLLGHAAKHIDADRVQLEDGTSLRARVVVDARGPAIDAGLRHSEGYQKFLGLEVELAAAHGLDRPLLMDATVAQQDGFRFVYTLPLTPTRLLVEDTYFSNTPGLDRVHLRERLIEYIARWGREVVRIEREEEGILPMPWRGRLPQPGWGPLRAGYRGGYFHPGTGYSLPVAARLAENLAGLPRAVDAAAALQELASTLRRQAVFCHLLNAMLFCWFPPAERWHVFRRFYRLPLETIERFYALRLRPIDMARLLLGRPPRGMSLRYGLTREGRS